MGDMNEEMAVPRGKVVDEDGNPVAGVQVTLVNGKNRPFHQCRPTGANGEFELNPGVPLPGDAQAFLFHPEHLRLFGPVPGNADITYELKKRTKTRGANAPGLAGIRTAFVETGNNGLTTVIEKTCGEDGSMPFLHEPGCLYRNLPYGEKPSGMTAISPAMEPAPVPSLEDLAKDLRYSDPVLDHHTPRQTTYRVGDDTHLRFFFVPDSFDDAVAFAPLVARYDETRDTGSKIRHDRVCPVARFGIRSGISYVAYKVPGPSIDDLVVEKGPLSADDVKQIGRDVAGVLPLLAEQKLCHGNLTPLFIYKGEEGWSISPACPAISIGEKYERTHHLQEGFEGDDLFGLGATLYFAACGRMPTWEEGKLRPTEKGLDDLLEFLLNRENRPSLEEALEKLA